MKRFSKFIQESIELEEKLKASDDMGDWVKDFQDSDAPQFKGKSQKKRQQMAIAAKLDAEREAGMRKEEVEQIDEISKDLATNYYRKASKDIGDQARSANDLRGGSSDLKGRLDRTYNRDGSRTKPEDRKKDSDTISRYDTSRKTAERKVKNRAVGMSRASTRMEEVELDEVSDKKLDAYRQKAFADQPAGDDGSDKYRKRKFGRDLAFAKQTGRAKVLATKEAVELDEASTKVEIPKSRYETILKMHGPKKTVRTPKGEMQYRGAEHFAHNKNTDTRITQTYSHPDHNIATIEKHTHGPSGKITHYMYKKQKSESVELDEAKTDVYHKHMLKALGKSRLPKDHSFTSAIATNGDFVVKDGGGRIAARIPKGEHNLKDK